MFQSTSYCYDVGKAIWFNVLRIALEEVSCDLTYKEGRKRIRISTKVVAVKIKLLVAQAVGATASQI
jgi:hypothetical protein